MKQTRSLSEFSCLSEFNQLYSRLGLINRGRNGNRLAVHIMLYRLFIAGGGGGATNKGAVKCDFQQYGILTSVDSDEPLQPSFQLRNSIWCSVSSLTIIEYSND